MALSNSPLEVIQFDPLASELCGEAYELYCDAFYAQPPEDFLRDVMDDVGFVAKILGQTVSMAFVNLNHSDRTLNNIARLDLLATKEGLRSQGIGRKFLGAIEAFAANEQQAAVELLASKDEARKFYLDNGYAPSARGSCLLRKYL